MFDYITVVTDKEYREAGKLFEEYANWLNIDLTFQNFEEELLSLKKMYNEPLGTIILCKKNKDYVGSIAVRPNEKGIAELKRMYVKPSFQKMKIGQALLDLSIQFAINAGYKKIRLDTLDHMTPAINLYLKNGFYKIPSYYYNPEKNAVYFEKAL
jgi:carbonic anhydrase